MNKNILDIITTSIEAAVNPTLWNKTLDLMVDNYGAKSGVLLVLDPQHESRLSLAMSRFIRVDAYESFEKFMRQEDSDDRVAFEKVFTLPVNTITSEYELFGVSQYNDMPKSSFRDWLRAQFDIIHRYGLKLNQHGPWLDCLILHTDSGKGVLHQNEATEINQLSSILSSSLKSFRVMEQLRSQFNATLSALDHLGIACFLTIENAQVIHRNKMASDILDAEDGLSINHSGQLSAIDPHMNAKIYHNCQQIYLTAKAENMVSESVFSINRHSAKAPYLVIISPIIDIYAELETGLKCALVYVVDSSLKKSVSAAGLMKIGGLTRAESEICDLLIQGLSTKQMMEGRNVSENTIRQQIKVILGKLHCNSRVDLLRMAIDTHLPIKG